MKVLIQNILKTSKSIELSREKKHTKALQKHSGKTMALAVTFLQHIKRERTKVRFIRHVKNGIIVLLFAIHTHPNRNEPFLQTPPGCRHSVGVSADTSQPWPAGTQSTLPNCLTSTEQAAITPGKYMGGTGC